MKFKIDENLHPDVAALLTQRGHDAATVHDEGLRGSDDATIAGICRIEQRALITLDLDFSDIRAYPPGQYFGLIVIRATDQSRSAIERLMLRVVPLLDTEPLAGKLWIADEHHVRVRGS
jgi:predicted nuclease of predicted toxin-antitoxin system